MKWSSLTTLLLLLVGLSSAVLAGSPVACDRANTSSAAGPSVQTRWNALELTLTVPKPEFRAGEPVEARLAVENTADAPVVLGDVPFKTFDLTVYDQTGATVWVWSETRPPLPLGIPGFRHLNRGDTFADVLTWDQTRARPAKGATRPAPRGTYLLEGVVHLSFPGGPAPVTLRSPRLPIVLRN